MLNSKFKLSNGYTLRTMLDQHIVMANGNENVKGCIVLNDSGAFLWRHLQEPKSKEQLVDLVLAEYDTTFDIAGQAVDVFIEQMRNLQILEAVNE